MTDLLVRQRLVRAMEGERSRIAHLTIRQNPPTGACAVQCIDGIGSVKLRFSMRLARLNNACIDNKTSASGQATDAIRRALMTKPMTIVLGGPARRLVSAFVAEIVTIVGPARQRRKGSWLLVRLRVSRFGMQPTATFSKTEAAAMMVARPPSTTMPMSEYFPSLHQIWGFELLGLTSTMNVAQVGWRRGPYGW